MRNKTETLKNMKHLKKITQKIIDNDNKQTQAEIPPSLKETLQKITEEMDKWKDRVGKIEQGAIRGKFFYKDDKRFSPQEVFDKLDIYNLVITITIDQIQSISPNSKITPKQKGTKKQKFHTSKKQKL